jgi:hypothetical protein
MHTDGAPGFTKSTGGGLGRALSNFSFSNPDSDCDTVSMTVNSFLKFMGWINGMTVAMSGTLKKFRLPWMDSTITEFDS